MVSWPVTLTGSSCPARTGAGIPPDFFDFGAAVFGVSAWAKAGESIVANTHTIAIALLLNASFREQPTPPLAGQKVRVNFADKIHRSRNERHVIRRQLGNHPLDRAHRIALDPCRAMRREMRREFLGLKRQFG